MDNNTFIGGLVDNNMVSKFGLKCLLLIFIQFKIQSPLPKCGLSKYIRIHTREKLLTILNITFTIFALKEKRRKTNKQANFDKIAILSTLESMQNPFLYPLAIFKILVFLYLKELPKSSTEGHFTHIYPSVIS